MKKLALAFALSLTVASLLAHEGHDEGKSCDASKGKDIVAEGKVSCKGDDCTFQTADAKATYPICEMSKADLPKLAAKGDTIQVSGKLIHCDGQDKLRILKVE